jgi:hypothetical protein
MRPRRERIYGDSGLIREIDLADNAPIDELKAEATEMVRASSARKLAAIAPALADRDRFILLLVRYCRLLRGSVDETRLSAAEAAALGQIDVLFARAQAVRKAADDIEAQVSATSEARPLFDLVESLDSNPLWPE